MATKKKQKEAVQAAPRPPIITVMGHVDHGKTTLLDSLRQAHVADKEHGGITQHIGAYQVEYQGKRLTFIDTPGHAAFSKMRERGATVTDLVVLVVAANDGVKPQTVESIKHIQTAGVPILVAINKIDMPGAQGDKVKAQLTEHQVFVEGYGGQVPAVEISAKNQTNLNELLEVLLLMAEVEGFTADPTAPLEAVVIESSLDKRRGSVATAIVKQGTIKTGQEVFVGELANPVRAMFDDSGKVIKEGLPGQPVELMGFKIVPPVGSVITDRAMVKVAEVEEPSEETDEPVEQGEEENNNRIKLIMKADTAGSLEAVLQSVMQPEIQLIDSGIGPIGEADVLLAQTTGSQLIGFNVPVTKSAATLARLEGIKPKIFNIIYELIEYLEKRVLKLIEPTIDMEELGRATVKAIFNIKGDRIAGCSVDSGKINKNDLVQVLRGDTVTSESKISSLKQGKEDVAQVKAGKECGIVLKDLIDFKTGDVIKSYRIINED